MWSGQIPLDVNLAALFYPDWALFRSLTAGARLPLWDAAKNMGEPFWADPQTMAAYPFTWLAAAAPDFAGFLRIWVVLHTLIASGFAAAWVRRAGGGLAAAATAAAVAGLNGFFMARATLPNHFAAASWLFPTLYFEETGSWRALAASLAMAWLAGFPPFFIVIVAAALLMAAWRGRESLRLLAAALFMAAGLSALQWLPFLEFLRHSARPFVLKAAEATRYSLPPLQLLKEAFLPFWSAVSPKIEGDPAIVGFYVGLPALGLALVGALKGGRRERGLALLGAAAALLSLGAHLPGESSLPILRVFRFPANWLLASIAAVAALAARGAQELSSGWRGLAAAAVAADLALFSQFPLTAWSRPAFLADEPALAARLAGPGSPPGRIFHTARMRRLWERARFRDERDFLMLREFLAPSFGTAFGVQEAASYQVLTTKLAARYLARLGGLGAGRLLDGAGVAAVVDPAPGARALGLGVVRVLWRPSSRSRVFLAGGRGTAEIESYRPGEIGARVRAETPATVVFSEIDYPGWRAFLDGREIPHGRFEGAFPAVEIPPGEHELRFKFSSRAVMAGLAISGVSLAAMALPILP